MTRRGLTWAGLGDIVHIIQSAEEPTMSRMKDAAETTVEMIESLELEELAALPWASESVRYAARCARRGYLGGAVTGLVRDAMLTDRTMLEMEGRIAALERMAGAAYGRAMYPAAPPVYEPTEAGEAAVDRVTRLWDEPVRPGVSRSNAAPGGPPVTITMSEESERRAAMDRRLLSGEAVSLDGGSVRVFASEAMRSAWRDHEHAATPAGEPTEAGVTDGDDDGAGDGADPEDCEVG